MLRLATLVVALAACGRIGFTAANGGDDAGPTVDAALPDGRWQRLAMDGFSVCAITTGGELFCWGSNFNGIVGTGDSTSWEPVTQVGIATDWNLVDARNLNGCGIRGTDLYCWGQNIYGGVGVNPVGNLVLPPTRVDLNAWRTVTIGYGFVCGVRTDDTGWCWGYGLDGQRGDGTTMTDRTMGQVAGAWKTIEAGDASTCGIKTDDTLWCWGNGGQYSLGQGTESDSAVPVALEPTRRWRTVSGGSNGHCALELDGTAWCWGRNDYGQGGGGDRDTLVAPREVGGPKFAQLVASELSTCGLTDSGELWCWGRTDRGVFGTIDDQYVTPTRIGAVPFAQVGVAGQTLCLIDPEHHLFCVGANGAGQLGQGTAGERQVLARVDDLVWEELYQGYNALCGRTKDGTTHCWGRNDGGQVGDGTTRDQQTPQPIGMFDRVHTAPGASVGHDGNAVFMWGSNPAMQGYSTSPVQRFANASDGAIGYRHVCWIESPSTLKCGGENDHGQLGDNTTMSKSETIVTGNWTRVFASFDFTCGLRDTSVLECWGEGTKAGGPSATDTLVPVATSNGQRVDKVALTETSGCFLTNGELHCWGVNVEGAIGNGTNADQQTEIQIGTRTDWIDLGAGDLHVCGITADHALWCWGHADEGQLGQPLQGAVRMPRQMGTDHDWMQVVGANHVTCALKTDGSRWCTGSNNRGELGDGLSWSSKFVVIP